MFDIWKFPTIALVVGCAAQEHMWLQKKHTSAVKHFQSSASLFEPYSPHEQGAVLHQLAVCLKASIDPKPGSTGVDNGVSHNKPPHTKSHIRMVHVSHPPHARLIKLRIGMSSCELSRACHCAVAHIAELFFCDLIFITLYVKFFASTFHHSVICAA